MNRAAVIGFPITHSLSPEIFKLLSQKTGIPVEYGKLAVEPRSFKRKLVAAKANYAGWNVTLPHKESAFKAVDHCDRVAARLGAVNVIRFRSRRAWGFNTDVIGVRETFRMQNFIVKGKKAVVYGAGGGAAAVVYALGASSCAEVILINRTRERARKLSEKLTEVFPKTRFRVRSTAPADADLYVNTTPLGMDAFPGSPKLPVFVPAPANDPRDVLVFDLIYHPIETSFLRAARAQGAETVNGLDMLVGQAIATWEIWFGKLPRSANRKRLHQDVRKHLLNFMVGQLK